MDFGGQEYKDPTETRKWLTDRGVLFDIFGMTKVTGPDKSPLYQWLFKSTANHEILWNFSTVFVIGRDGGVRARFDKPQANDWALVKEELAACLKEEAKEAYEDDYKGEML